MDIGSESINAEAPRGSRPRFLARAIVLIALLGAAAIRVRLLDVPLERDEGEYAYAGQLMLQGVPPYRLAYNMKFPGTYAAYALLMGLFGQSTRGIHLGLLVANATAVLLVYLLGRRLRDEMTGAVAGAAYAFLSLSQSVLGAFAHATHFVVLPALAGSLVLMRWADGGGRRTLFLAGAILGLAPLMKQHGLFFPVFGALYAVWEGRRRHPGSRARVADLGTFGLGAALPVLLTGVALLAGGVLRTFWFWTFEYATQYVAQVDPAQGGRLLVATLAWIVRQSPLVWGLAAVGLTSLRWDGESRRRAPFLLGFLAASFLTVCPGLFFRRHYFVVLLPAVALLAGIAVRALHRVLLKAGRPAVAALAAGLLAAAAIGTQLVVEREYLFRLTPREASRRSYGPNPFPEAVEIARHIAAGSGPDDRVAVLGSEPEICFYAGRRCATGHLYMYGLMEKQPYAAAMQREAAREIEASSPRFLVMVNVPQSWGANPGSNPWILEWASRYIDEHYRVDGLADLVSSESTVYRWGADATGARPGSPYHIWIFRRRDAS
jgi:hypothetical protein